MVGNENFSLNLQNDENEQFNLEIQNEDTERFTVDFGEVINIGGGTSDFNELENRPKYNSQEMTGNTNIPAIPTKVSNLQNDAGYQTSSQVTSTVNAAVAVETGARQSADNGLQSQIDAITASSDVTDIVGTYADLEDYDTSTLGNNDIIKVLQDESHSDETTYYRWNKTAGAFSLIGEEGPYYTKSQTDTLLSGKQAALTAGTNISISGSTISATDTTYTASSGLSLTGTAFSVDTTTIATVSYVNGLVGDIETALHAINNGGE